MATSNHIHTTTQTKNHLSQEPEPQDTENIGEDQKKVSLNTMTKYKKKEHGKH